MIREFTSYILAACALAAQELPRGQILDRVAVRDNDRQAYALYLPSTYTPDHAWPILYCLDPGARGRVPVERFSQAAEKAGFLVAGSLNSRNGPLAPSEEAIRLMLTDTHARLAIDDSRVYVAGLSGGARLALAWAQNGQIAGVVACSAAFGSPSLPKQIPFRIFATTGVDDFNHDELFRMSRDLAKRNIAHRYVEFEGGHEWLPAPLATEALEFFLGLVPPQAATPSKEQSKQASQFESLMQQAATASDTEKPALIHRLQKDAAKPEDSGDRRVARRVLGNISIESVERGRELMASREYASAARIYETAVLLRPENAGAWYSLAVAQSAAGNARRALDALEQAAAHGFRDIDRMEREPLLAKARREARYQAIVQKLR